MGVIEFIILCAIIGVVIWAVTTLIPMPEAIRKLITIVAVLVLILILVRALVGDVPMPRLR